MQELLPSLPPLIFGAMHSHMETTPNFGAVLCNAGKKLNRLPLLFGHRSSKKSGLHP